ncbi:MAG TPA: hypothetical protein VHM90_05735 [Phycisphaerae bacterium]|jgi:hypothetical protein|nr:hypothetical protein [Phycisphaerae bacterium]
MFERLKKWGAKKALEHIVERGVAMTLLKIDRHRKTLAADLELEGETAPVQVTAAYSLETMPDGGRAISLSDIHVSRAWLQVMARFALAGKKIAIPAEAGDFAALLL